MSACASLLLLALARAGVQVSLMMLGEGYFISVSISCEAG